MKRNLFLVAIGCLSVIGFTMPLLLCVTCQSSLRSIPQPLVMNQFKKPFEKLEKPRPDPGIAAHRQSLPQQVNAPVPEKPLLVAKEKPPGKLVLSWSEAPSEVVSRRGRYDRSLKAAREAIDRLKTTHPVRVNKYVNQLKRYIDIITERGILWESRYQTEAISTKFNTIRRNVLADCTNPVGGWSQAMSKKAN